MTPYGSQRPLGNSDEVRRKQITSLRQRNRTAVVRVPDEEFEVHFRAGQQNFSLLINLPMQFPGMPPVVRVSPMGFSHPLLDPSGNVLDDKLRFGVWSYNSDLGRIIQDVTNRFIQQPPVPGGPQGGSYGGQPSFPYGQQQSAQPQQQQSWSGPYARNFKPGMQGGGSGVMSWGGPQQPQGGYGGYQQQQQQQQPLQPTPNSYSQPHSASSRPSTPNVQPPQEFDVKIPTVPKSFTELQNLNKLELDDLMKKPDAFEAFFEKLEVIDTCRKIRNDLVAENDKLAKNNVEFKSESESAKAELDQRRLAVDAMRSEYEQKSRRQKELLDKFSPDAIRSQLAQRRDEAEQTSDEIAQQFLSGSMPFNDFLKDFMKHRELFHQRNAKLSRLD